MRSYRGLLALKGALEKLRRLRAPEGKRYPEMGGGER